VPLNVQRAACLPYIPTRYAIASSSPFAPTSHGLPSVANADDQHVWWPGITQALATASPSLIDLGLSGVIRSAGGVISTASLAQVQ
jgi:hypothetical protein